jgi:phosphoribosylformylglycinamidine synthase
MGRVVVEVMPKSEILDPQGKAIINALRRMGIDQFEGARQGKRFVLEVEGDVTSAHLEAAKEAAAKLLSNPVIEDVINVFDSDLEAVDSELSAKAHATASSLGKADTDLAKIIAATAFNGAENG